MINGAGKKKGKDMQHRFCAKKKFGKQKFIVKKCVCLVNLTAELLLSELW